MSNELSAGHAQWCGSESSSCWIEPSPIRVQHVLEPSERVRPWPTRTMQRNSAAPPWPSAAISAYENSVAPSHRDAPQTPLGVVIVDGTDHHLPGGASTPSSSSARRLPLDRPGGNTALILRPRLLARYTVGCHAHFAAFPNALRKSTAEGDKGRYSPNRPKAA
jgi:hypothetical protein